MIIYLKTLALTEKHKTIKYKAKVYVDGDIHTNTVENRFLAPQARHHRNMASHLGKASRGLSGRHDFPIQPSEECEFAPEHLASYDHCARFDLREINRMIFTGVNCKSPNCGETIALQQVSYSPQAGRWINQNVKDFPISCDHCHETRTYSADDIYLFES